MTATAGSSARGRAGLATAFAVLTVGTLPQALLGGLAVPMSADLGYDERGLGLAVSAFWLLAGVASPLAGRAGDRRGWPRIATVGLAASGTSLLALALVPHGLAAVVLAMAVAGAGAALCSQSSNLTLVAEVSAHRLGQAFGIKQSAPAAGWLLAGLAVPLVAATWGWRPVFVLAALTVPAVALLVRRTARRTRPGAIRRGADATFHAIAGSGQGRPRWTLVLAFGLGTATISALSTFGLTTLVRSGLSVPQAGWVVAAAGALALVGRVAAGAWLDRGEARMQPASMLLLATMSGLALLAVPSPAAAVAGLVIALACGSGWPPVALVVIVRTWSDSPGRATGIVSVGAAAGSIVGPLVFGATAAWAGYAWAWIALACFAAASAAMMLLRLAPGPLTTPSRPAPAA